MALIPSAGIMSAPKPNSKTSGATFVISPGTSEPMAPIIEAAAEAPDWRDWVAVLDDDDLPLLLPLPLDESAAWDR